MEASFRCVCPPKADGQARHDTDTAVFRDRLDFVAGQAISKQIGLAKADDPDMSAGEILALMSLDYILHGLQSWTLVDEKNKPITPTRSVLRAFLNDHYEAATVMVEVVDDLYQEQVLLPLLRRASMLSQQSPTPEPTSASPETSGSSSMSQKRSKHSLTSTTQTDDTGTISSLPAGGSKSSRSSATAA